MPSQLVHVVMGSGIVFGAYWRADLAIQHARCITGTTVAAVDLDGIPSTLRAILEAEILDELPLAIRIDIQEAEWENEEDITPVIEAEIDIEVALDEIDDKLDVGPHE